jgi:ABC-type polysaccharide/polyol phosphate transport system ATPase subunit
MTATAHRNPQGALEEAAVVVRNLSKTYRLGELEGLAGRANAFVRRRRTGPRAQVQALAGVSLDIRSGECLGIVGKNGSGKSTLMQILAGITLPSDGELVVRGRVLPLLAVGSCFHPELTGRENILLFASILGISRQTAFARMPDIATFAELERHLDTPNKRYSDGMQARLSFAVAMLFPADIYLFDEVLAVVDGEFRDRCLTSITDLVRSGKTVIFISHDLNQVEALCSRAVWLEAGKLRQVGVPGRVLADYRARLAIHDSGAALS